MYYDNNDVVIFVTFNELNVTGCEHFLDVAQGLGEPRTLVPLMFCVYVLLFLVFRWCIYHFSLQRFF